MRFVLPPVQRGHGMADFPLQAQDGAVQPHDQRQRHIRDEHLIAGIPQHRPQRKNLLHQVGFEMIARHIAGEISGGGLRSGVGDQCNCLQTCLIQQVGHADLLGLYHGMERSTPGGFDFDLIRQQ